MQAQPAINSPSSHGTRRREAEAERHVQGNPKVDAFADVPKLGAGEVRQVVENMGGVQVRPVRTRFAPSPTGHLHIGGARTALFNYLAAKALGGEFLLRIEDTDAERSKPEYTAALMDGLQWLGIEWDGEVVFQSKRIDLYNRKIDELIKTGKAYADKDGTVRFKMTLGRVEIVRDFVRGNVPVMISAENGTADYVIRRSNGQPTFLLANAVDDGETGVTHVIRGDDHLINTAKQIELIRALGYPVPYFFHVSLIHGDDGQKLSKRKGAQSVVDFRNMGYEPLAVVNHLARLGARHGPDEGTLSVEELAQQFDVFSFASSPARIGFAALDVRDRRLIASEPTEYVAERIADLDPDLADALGPSGLDALAAGCQRRASSVGEAAAIGQFILAEPVYGPGLEAVYLGAKVSGILRELSAALSAVPAEQWTLGTLEEVFARFNEQGHRFGDYQVALRWALTGVDTGLPVDATLAILGRDRALRRLSHALDGIR